MRGYGLKNVRQRRDDALTRVGWDQLELLLAAYYRGQGYAVEHVGTAGAGSRFDGGIDLKLRRGDEYVVVQCKHWNAKQVPHNDVHQLLGVMLSEVATGAIFVTSGEFSAYAVESAARSGRVQLVDGEALRAMLGPLPLPPAPQANAIGATPSKAEAIASLVGERLLAAAEARVRAGRWGSSRAAVARPLAALAVAKLVMPFVLLFAAYWIITGAIERVQTDLATRSASRQGQAGTTAKPAGPDLPTPRAAVGQPVVPTSSTPRSYGRDSSNPCHELIDWQSGTYVDHCAPKTARRETTAAERAELQRRADESIRVLAPNTPELILE
jgi:restriction system protein